MLQWLYSPDHCSHPLLFNIHTHPKEGNWNTQGVGSQDPTFLKESIEYILSRPAHWYFCINFCGNVIYIVSKLITTKYSLLYQQDTSHWNLNFRPKLETAGTFPDICQNTNGWLSLSDEPQLKLNELKNLKAHRNIGCIGFKRVHLIHHRNKY